ncbi:MAG: RDD family protein [Thermosynechococcaceae cyanobacterium]
MTFDPYPQRLPPPPPSKAQMWPRLAASAIDFLFAWLLSTVAITGDAKLQIGQWIIFAVLWMLFRVVIVVNNQGQSPGHWAMDMKVINARSIQLPRIEDLIKREAIAGGCCLLALIGFNLGGFAVLACIAPLIINTGIGLSDPVRLQTLHDRWVNTAVVYTTRGYSLDLKVKKILTQAQQRVR